MMKSNQSSSATIRSIALYEFGKGVLALITTAVIWHEQARLSVVARVLTQHLHQLFGTLIAKQIEQLSHLLQSATQDINTVLALLIIYALMRFAESYGLYREKTWGFWLSLLGYGLFLPVEVYALITRFDLFHALVVSLNIVIMLVVYRHLSGRLHHSDSDMS